MAETIAQLDGPIYVERVALFDNKQRHRAELAIKKALRLQVENRGLSFVEVLAECPTHLHLTPVEAEQWVREKMLPFFPLGVKKDLTPEPWFALEPPSFDAARIVRAVGGDRERPARFGTGFPAHLDPADVAIKFAGSGGDGAQTIALLTSRVAINEGFDATYIPSYGPESRGGTSYADVHVATGEVLSPAAPEPHVLVAFNGESLRKFGPRVRAGGLVLYDSSVIPEPPLLDPSLRVVGVPFTRLAAELGAVKVKNIVALGAFQAASRLAPAESFRAAIGETLRSQGQLLPLNEQAFALGGEAVRGGVSPAEIGA
jgi:2-oxoisovalerate ferredoxin oxidoreductase beta subunit